MKVTKVEALTKTKFRVELDSGSSFVLYKGELKQFEIEEGAELSDDVYERIKKEVLVKRARLRALHLLNAMDRTETGLYQKLAQGMYPPEIIEDAMAYVRSFSYVDDERYAQNFVLSRRSVKSRKEIFFLLCERGISKKQAEQAVARYCDEDSQREAINRIIRKKHVDLDNMPEREFQKLYGYLARKGFHCEDIRQVIQNHNKNA